MSEIGHVIGWFAKPHRTWIYVWLGYSIPLLPSLFVQADLNVLIVVALQVLFGLLLACLALPQHILRGALLMCLVGLGLTGLWQRSLSAHSWRLAPGSSSKMSTGFSWYGPVNKISAGAEGRSGIRVWSVSAEELNFSTELRLVDAASEQSWFADQGTIQLSTARDGILTYAHFDPGEHGSYISRAFRTARPLANRRFEMTLSFRSLQVENCPKIIMAQQGGVFRKVFQVCADKEWQLHRFEWQVPLEADLRTLVVSILADANKDIHLAGLELEEAGVSIPSTLTGIHFRLRWEGQREDDWPYLHILPTSTWERYEVKAFTSGQGLLRAELWLEPDSKVEIRRTSLRPRSAVRAKAERLREAFGTPHPNLAGHAAASLFLMMLYLRVPTTQALPGLAAALVCVWLTGSRTALFSLYGGVFIMVWRLSGRRMRFTFFILFTLVTLVSWSYLGRLVQLSSDAFVRWEVWQASLLAFCDHIWFGLGGDLNTYLTTSTYRETEISHAHNFFLDQAVRFGIAGLISSLWLCGSLLYLSAKHSGMTGLCAIGLVIFMNFIDTSLFYVGVFVPIVLALQVKMIRD